MPPEIGTLTALETLFLTANQLTELPPEIGALTTLKQLFLNSNRLAAFPKEVSSLAALEVLDLEENRLTTFPPELLSLRALRLLDFRRNAISKLPPEVGALAALQTLHLEYNQLASLPPEIGSLTALQRLWLNDNQLAALPPEVGALAALQTLHLENNQLASLPPALGDLPELKALFLHGNLGLDLPPEILGPTRAQCRPMGDADPTKPAEILRFYFRRQAEQADAHGRGEAANFCTLNEVKILVVGEPGVGKTDLTHWLIHGKPHPDPKSTIGIKIATWTLPAEDGPAIRANVWDFGGQEIMQATHQFFLTERSLYLLVLDSRENEEQGKVRYWLDKIRAFGGDSPVIVVMNKVDEGQEQPDEPRLTKDYSRNILDGFFRTACRGGKWAKAGDGINALRSAIIRRASQIENVRTGVPRSYLTAKERIEQDAAEFKKLDRGQFEKACNESGVHDPLDRSTLLTFLMCLGTVYHYERPGRPGAAARTFVLDPEWLSDGVYTILTANQLLHTAGKLNPKELKALFAGTAAEREYQYCEEDYDFLLEMMEGDPFELCFRIPNNPDDVRLVPERLPPYEPNHGIKPEDATNVEYHYQYLPGGLIPRFVVRMHEWLKPGDAWRSGVVLTIRGQRVLVRGVKEQKRVFVSAEGRTEASRYALGIVRENLASIHGAMRHVKVEERVPLPDRLDVSVTYESLCKLEADPKKGPNYEWTPDKAERDYSVRELLDTIEPPEAREQRRRLDRGIDELAEKPEKRPRPAEQALPPEPKQPGFAVLSAIIVGVVVVLILTLALASRMTDGVTTFAILAVVAVLLCVVVLVFVSLFSEALDGTKVKEIILKVLDSLSILQALGTQKPPAGTTPAATRGKLKPQTSSGARKRAPPKAAPDAMKTK